jgi:hypothetical protein
MRGHGRLRIGPPKSWVPHSSRLHRDGWDVNRPPLLLSFRSAAEESASRSRRNKSVIERSSTAPPRAWPVHQYRCLANRCRPCSNSSEQYERLNPNCSILAKRLRSPSGPVRSSTNVPRISPGGGPLDEREPGHISQSSVDQPRHSDLRHATTRPVESVIFKPDFRPIARNAVPLSLWREVNIILPSTWVAKI